MYAWLQSLLPEMIAQSRKGMIWFCGGGCASLLELLKSLGPLLGWPPDAVQKWSNKLLLIQGVLLTIAAMWTQQITREDTALKTGLPPPNPAAAPPPVQTQTVNVGSPVSAPPTAPVVDHEIKR